MKKYKSLFVALVAINVAIIAHELGHAAAMVACGIEVGKISLGLGPSLFSWQIGNTAWAIGPLPLGGFTAPRDPQQALQAPLWSRELVGLSGIAVNACLAWVSLAVLRRHVDPGIKEQLVFFESRPWSWPVVREGLAVLVRIVLTPYQFFRCLFTEGPRGLARQINGPAAVVQDLQRLYSDRQSRVRLSYKSGGMDKCLKTPPAWARVLNGFLWVNLGFAGLNGLPFLPLDGGQMVQRAVAFCHPLAGTAFEALSLVVASVLIALVVVHKIVPDHRPEVTDLPPPSASPPKRNL